MKGLYLRTVYFLGVTSGGSVTHTSGVINAMSKKIELDVVSNDQLVGVKHPVRIINPSLPKIPVFGELSYNFKLLRKATSLKPKSYDFIYQRYSGESFFGALLASKHNIPFVLEFNSSEIWKLQNWSKTNSGLKNFFKRFVQLPIVKKIEAYNLKKADIIVVVSEVLKDNLTAIGIDPNKILVNPNGVEIEKFESTPESNSVRQKHQLDNYFTYGFIGTFGKWHGVVELAKSIIQFYDNHPQKLNSVKFLIIGYGKLYQEVEDIISASKYSDNIILTGQIPQGENAAYLNACDAFVSPHIPNPDGTKFFGSPTKLFEYMACKKPIIASRLDQIGEILEHNQNAYLVEPGNIEELADAYNVLYQDKQLQQTLAENSYALVKQKYTWDSHVDHILSRIKELAGK